MDWKIGLAYQNPTVECKSPYEFQIIIEIYRHTLQLKSFNTCVAGVSVSSSVIIALTKAEFDIFTCRNRAHHKIYQVSMMQYQTVFIL